LPEFKVQLSKTYQIDENVLQYEGALDLAGVDWMPGEPPNPFDCLHVRGIGGIDTPEILAKFLENRVDLLSRIQAVEFNRFFSTNLNDRFSAIMPALEAYLKGRYTSPDELTFIHLEEAFFNFINESKNDNFIEFSRKHLSVKDRKSPSLTTLLTRAIDFVNNKGFIFPSELATKIQKRRGRQFHSVIGMSQSDVMGFYEEVQAACALLMLHTFDDLGIDISLLSQRHSALRDMRAFLPKRT
jgi:hypothetical protein